MFFFQIILFTTRHIIKVARKPLVQRTTRKSEGDKIKMLGRYLFQIGNKKA